MQSREQLGDLHERVEDGGQVGCQPRRPGVSHLATLHHEAWRQCVAGVREGRLVGHRAEESRHVAGHARRREEGRDAIERRPPHTKLEGHWSGRPSGKSLSKLDDGGAAEALVHTAEQLVPALARDACSP